MFKQGKIVVCGDIMLDKYLNGITDRISPEAPVPVVNLTNENAIPGGASNVAMNIGALGGDVCLMGITGKDDAAAQLSAIFKKQALKNSILKSKNYSTIVKCRIVSHHQQLMRLDTEVPMKEEDIEVFTARALRHFCGAECLVLSDYAKGTLTHVHRLINKARALDIPIIVDPKGSCFAKYSGATVITPNIKEFLAVVGNASCEAEIEAKAADLCERFNIAYLLLTRSEKGLSLYSQQGLSKHFSAAQEEVFDVTGAGDTVVATIAMSLMSQIPLEIACDLATVAAGIVVKKFGTATVSHRELAERLSSDIKRRANQQ